MLQSVLYCTPMPLNGFILYTSVRKGWDRKQWWDIWDFQYKSSYLISPSFISSLSESGLLSEDSGQCKGKRRTFTLLTSWSQSEQEVWLVMAC